MKNYKAYCLSLVSNTDRREWMLSIKDKIGLDFEFWDATTPDEVTDDIKECYFKYVNYYEWDVIQDAVMATFVSHMNILKWAADNQTNVILIEDDIDIVNPFDWDSLKWDEFDVFKLGTKGIDCYAYAVSWEGAARLLLHYNSIQITEAYDLELHKVKHLRFKYLYKPVFIQVQNRFVSNLAPNGYKKLKNGKRNTKLY